ncbi:putative lipoprotein [Flavobacterium daejeonense]|nr:putative lipoprotein [Flavobacterium daejeonense]
MKNIHKYIALTVLVTLSVSCKDEKQEMAHQKVAQFTMYVDSISRVATDETTKNWESIQVRYEKVKMEAQDAMNQLENKMDMETLIDKADSKYEEYKAAVLLKRDAMLRENFRNSFFTENVGEDMKFEWVNKDNIADVYLHFIGTIEQNKDSYTREDWDEIKLIYEALDTRKNTVEKEGLSSKDNIKIAGLKIKFATLYQINRATAKSKENTEAKE